jgi:riboflavin kinase, archaea type
MVVAEDLQCLKAIALLGGCSGPIWVSSQTFGRSLDISPQTASRRLISLERQMLITRSIRPEGQYVTITKDGERELKREYHEYSRIFSKKQNQFRLAGTVISGLGEGRYYMSLSHYRHQFMEHLGFEPFPGTLNIRLNAPSIEVRKQLDRLAWIEIEGFTADNRTFGAARALPCRIAEIPCAIVVPARSHYPEDIIEVIAETGLRNALEVEDGDNLEVEIAHD